MTLREWVKGLLLFGAIMALSFAVWEIGRSLAVRTDNGGPLTWAFTASSLPCTVLMYLLTKRFRRRCPRVLAAVVACSPVLSACVAALVALGSGVIVALTAMNFPVLGVSLGWQLGGALQVTAESEG